ncbi:hypothetical protein GBAR_LOCUS27392 [Geodia barretti]|uniref:Uncharacterized protein n=1 Tax=Geodia barretti TaxID=519541 RepID=A0AA35X8V2_GEOBA|nr:hypothetical protein GBAR_LOCUS27392 [Geodia barretti]
MTTWKYQWLMEKDGRCSCRWRNNFADVVEERGRIHRPPTSPLRFEVVVYLICVFLADYRLLHTAALCLMYHPLKGPD